jgi:nucleoside-diphosphate-sugar epimerase
MKSFLLKFILTAAICVALISALAPKKVLIIQNKGGGHGEIGFSLSKVLLSGSHQVTILQDSCDKSAQPFCSYNQLQGLTVVDTKLKDIEAMKSFLSSGNKFDVVVDNNSKSTEAAAAISDAVKSYGPDSQYLYVSSGGMYKGKCGPNGYLEKDGETKDDNDCRIVEKYLESQDIKWTSFRPQYIYGDHTNKRSNVDWFVDRITRDRVVPLPGDGEQLVALSHVDDVSAIIAAAIGNAKAYKQVFNCGTDKYISYKGLCEAIAKASGKSVKFAHYDPKKLETKPSFPFRATTFIVDPAKAKTELGWKGAKHEVPSDMVAWLAQYKSYGLDQKAFDSAEDDAILQTLA